MTDEELKKLDKDVKKNKRLTSEKAMELHKKTGWNITKIHFIHQTNRNLWKNNFLKKWQRLC